MEFKIIKGEPSQDKAMNNESIANFLFEHLDEYGDTKEMILKCLQYVFNPVKGGFVLLALEEGEIVGAVVINKTGMDGYIPENILVYIAVNKNQRGKGVGKQLMEKTINEAEGSIALHVEPQNPAKKLYEKLGFTNKYLEMRLQR
jgi:[ribosomal protein S18]-alanine N-acetyltransferase